VFAPGWRDVNILGNRADAADDDEDVARMGAAARPQTLPLAGIVTIIVVLLGTGLQFVTDDFFGWYSRYGYATSTLRGDNDQRKITALQEMTRAQDDRLIEFTAMIEAQFDDPNASAALHEQAIYSLGEVARRMVRSLELMEQGTKGGKWVEPLYARLVAEVKPKLIAAITADPSVEHRRALIFALGTFRSRDAIAVFREQLMRPDRDRDTVTAIIKALSRYREPGRIVPLLLPVVAGEDSELASLAIWAIGELYGLGTGEASEAVADPALVQLIAQRAPAMPFETQCMVVDAMLRIRAAQLDETLFVLWDAVEPADRRCPRRLLERRFEGPLAMSKEEEMREKIVKALAGIADGNSRVMSWLRKKSTDERVAGGLRADMGYILDVLAGRRSIH